jgi:hypothetical protein
MANEQLWTRCPKEYWDGLYIAVERGYGEDISQVVRLALREFFVQNNIWEITETSKPIQIGASLLGSPLHLSSGPGQQILTRKQSTGNGDAGI